MKPFLGIDLTTDKNNEKLNGEEFLVAVPSSALTQSYERSSERAEETIKQANLPLPLRITQGICGVLGLLIATGTIRAVVGGDGLTLGQAYDNAAWMFWLGGACLSVWAILKFVSNKKAKAVLGTDESTSTFANLDGVCDAIYSELSVPSNAPEVDVLSFYYKVKDGNIKVREKGMQMAPYINPVFKVFTDSKNLYIANLEGKYAFPLTSLKLINTVKKNIRIIGWNKEESYNKGIYKQYKMTNDNYGCIYCKRYYILEVDCGDDLMGIYIPCYELPIFEELTGLKAQ